MTVNLSCKVCWDIATRVGPLARNSRWAIASQELFHLNSHFGSSLGFRKGHMAVSMWAPEEGADSAASSLGRLWKGMPLRTFIAVMNDCNDFNKGIDVQLLIEGSALVATLLDLDRRGGYIGNDDFGYGLDAPSDETTAKKRSRKKPFINFRTDSVPEDEEDSLPSEIVKRVANGMIKL